MHKYTLHPDDPDFVRAKMNALQISDVRQIFSYNKHKQHPSYADDVIIFSSFPIKKVYKATGEQVKTSGYDLRLDAIPFQTAKASREIASDVS